MPVASMKQLLESGVHFGHQTRRWNPKMKPYIFTERGGIHIIDLQQTTVLLDRAYDFVRNVAGRGGTVLFVGTKKQCQDIVSEEAARVEMPYVSHRWLGGLLTNFSTIENRIKRMHELRTLKEEGQLALLPTKERMAMERELEKLDVNLGGVGNMTRLPDAVFVVDPKREAIATKEVNKLGLPLIGLVDTNCDPDEVDYLIPGNDDAIRSCTLIIKTLAKAVEEGRQKVQVAEFLAAEAAATAPETQGAKAFVAEEEAGRSAAGGALPSRVSRTSRAPAGEGRQRAQGRSGGSRGGSSSRSAGAGRQTTREGGSQQQPVKRSPTSRKTASAKPTKSEKKPGSAVAAEKAAGAEEATAAKKAAAEKAAATKEAAAEKAAATKEAAAEKAAAAPKAGKAGEAPAEVQAESAQADSDSEA